jgi:photosystem II stability/assembly factor-like uncharacterized protein
MKPPYPIFLAMAIVMAVLSGCDKGQPAAIKSSESNAKVVLLPAQLPQSITALFFTDVKTGYVAGGGGGIYKTFNGGDSWQAENSNTNLPIYGLYFIDSNKGFAVGGESSCGGTGCVPPGGFILRTLDGGQSWARVYTTVEKTEITSVYFVNTNVGFCVGNNVIYKTTNGGLAWTAQAIENLGGKMMQIKFTDDKNGFIICLFDKIVQTDDGGLTWKVTSPQTNTGYYSIASAGGVTYVGGQGKVIKSTNNGNSWSVLANSPADVFAIYFKNSKNGIALGRGNYSGGDFGHSYASIYTTSDGGDSWTGSSDITGYSAINAVSFPNQSVGFGITGNKIIKITY